MLFYCWSGSEKETKSDVQFSALHNVDTISLSDVETTLKQRWYNFISTLFQPGLNVGEGYIKINRDSIITDWQINN